MFLDYVALVRNHQDDEMDDADDMIKKQQSGPVGSMYFFSLYFFDEVPRKTSKDTRTITHTHKQHLIPSVLQFICRN